MPWRAHAVSTTVDHDLLAEARSRTLGPNDAALLDAALDALVAPTASTASAPTAWMRSAPRWRSRWTAAVDEKQVPEQVFYQVVVIEAAAGIEHDDVRIRRRDGRHLKTRSELDAEFGEDFIIGDGPSAADDDDPSA